MAAGLATGEIGGKIEVKSGISCWCSAPAVGISEAKVALIILLDLQADHVAGHTDDAVAAHAHNVVRIGIVTAPHAEVVRCQAQHVRNLAQIAGCLFHADDVIHLGQARRGCSVHITHRARGHVVNDTRLARCYPRWS